MELVAPVTRSPAESSTHTTGCVGKAVPPLDAVGETWKAICVAPPATVKDALVPVARVRVLSVATRVKDPAFRERSCSRRSVATPLWAVTGLVVHVSVPVPVLIAICMESPDPVPLVTTFPPASSTATTGCVPKAALPVDAPGEVVNAT